MGILGWFFGSSEEDDIRECPNCRGAGEIKGFIFDRDCDRCKGTGEVVKREKYNEE